MIPHPDAEQDRLNFASQEWTFPTGVHYLNHGSFGPTPRSVLDVREQFQRELAANPMDFYLRKLETALDEAAARLARFVKCPADNLIFVSNSTAAMNIVAANVELNRDDEVLLTDHEYGAVVRIWGQVCQKAGARTVLVRLPEPLLSEDDVVEAIFAKVTPRTRLLVVSHVTSPTAVILPVKKICERARQQKLQVCIDGPHALAMRDLDLNSIPCDFYAVSCHKWLCAPLGSGFLYVRSRHKQGLQPSVVSWGRSLMGRPPSWKDEFHWPGTFDPTASLSIPAAIEWLEGYGIERFRTQMHALAQFARNQLLEIPGATALCPDSPDWYGTMVTVRLPLTDPEANPHLGHPLQLWLWENYRIEIPVLRWQDHVHVRASCHLYNSESQYVRLKTAVLEWLESVAV
ncbi:aminotransferase class V-fold PLP-dependent enzyme [Planctomicrobium sp. SH661]|uniref:aminotransferase class V-fold PLP-dependent enzyme n=1 Tax=Planctomicrobium sp. SH661 TaxID=3448124 RepID=UPI003F5C8523